MKGGGGNEYIVYHSAPGVEGESRSVCSVLQGRGRKKNRPICDIKRSETTLKEIPVDRVFEAECVRLEGVSQVHRKEKENRSEVQHVRMPFSPLLSSVLFCSVHLLIVCRRLPVP